MLTVLDELKSWVLEICTTESSAQLITLRRLESHLGKCAHWYHELRVVNIRLYLNYQSDLDDCAPYVLDHLQSTIADIAAFEKIAKLEIYMTKPARRHTRASWSRRLLARLRHDESQATILLGPTTHTEGDEWEEFEGFGLDVDCSASSRSSFGSWSDEEDDENQKHDTDDDQDGDIGYHENNYFSGWLPDQKGYESAEESDNNAGEGIDSDGDAGRVAGDEHRNTVHANNKGVGEASSHFDFFKLPREIRDSIYGQPGMLQDQVLSWENRMVFDPYNAVTAIKPCQSLLLVNRQFNKEYRESCEGRIGVFVDTRMEYLEPRWGPAVSMLRNAAQGAHFLHLRAGDWYMSNHDDDAINYLNSVYAWARHWCSQMPKLRSIHLQLHLDNDLTSKKLGHVRASISRILSLEKLQQCQVIVMSNSGEYRNQDQQKRMLMQWKLGEPSPPPFNDPPRELTEPYWGCETQTRGNGTLRAFEKIMSGENSDDDDDDKNLNPYLRFYKDDTVPSRTNNVRPALPISSDPSHMSHDTRALIADTIAPIFEPLPPPQDYTRESRLLRSLPKLIAVLVSLLLWVILEMISSSG